MIDTAKTPESATEDKNALTPNTAAQTSTNPAKTQDLSMHADVPVWYDCCSCEVEPYWLEAMDIESGEDS